MTKDLVEGLKERQLLWVDIDVDESGDLDGLDEILGVDRDDLTWTDDGDGTDTRLRLSEERLVITLDSLEPGKKDKTRIDHTQVRLLAGKNLVVSSHEGPSLTLARYAAELSGETRLGALTAASLLSTLTDEIIAGYFRVGEMIEQQIDELDQRALDGKRGDDVLAAMVALRRRIGLVRRLLARHRDAIAALGRPEMQVEELIGEPWPGLGDRLERAIDAVELLRESLLGTYDIHMGRAAQRANDTMKALTVLSAVLLPAVVLAGIMGMNFKLPIFEDPANGYIAIGAMIVSGVVILAAARWRGWL